MHNIQDSRELGNLIKAARKEQNLTQEEMSAVCGLGVRFIREVEKGKVTCQIGKVLHLVSSLGMRLLIARRNER